ncbi:unnamed protein product [Adineta steineri]|uniref:Dicer double-stranded RNA-binding domain-containing protein n=3 Tax=Adineta steineri TaxID=433720 RepID=A0A815GXJ5_9BILA|nr:unnamed protein product [Adineta steineri]CAF1344308.1 unnamed protein product [Adineta steineri]
MTLNLRWNQIGDIGAQYLCDALQHNTTLTTLDLRHNDIGDIGTQHLDDGTEMTGELLPLSSPVGYTNPSVLSTIQSYDFDRFEQLIGYRFHQRGDIFFDSNKSFNTVRKIYYPMLKPFIEKPERSLDGRIRIIVEIIGKGRFKGVRRNYRIEKTATAKCALKNLRRLD